MIEQERRPSADVVPRAPSARTLVKATIAALVLAVVVLIVAVLPAEYGIDPTGAGRALGLMELYEAGQAATALAGAAPIVPAAEGPVFRQLNDYRVDTREFTIPPRGGMEFKYRLDRGATMLYAWRATAFVDFDFHRSGGPAPRGLGQFRARHHRAVARRLRRPVCRHPRLVLGKPHRPRGDDHALDGRLLPGGHALPAGRHPGAQDPGALTLPCS
jgi:hypothetical protein